MVLEGRGGGQMGAGVGVGASTKETLTRLNKTVSKRDPGARHKTRKRSVIIAGAHEAVCAGSNAL